MGYNNTCKAEDKTSYVRSDKVTELMTNKQFDSYLENLAKLIESKAKTIEEAAKLIREAKTEQ